MNVREYLKGIKELDALIYCKKVRIQGLWSSVTYSGVSYDIRVQASKNFDRRTDTICKIIEIEEEIKAMIKELKQRQEIVKEAINNLENDEMSAIIYSKYIEFKSWETIAAEIGCSKRWAMKLHSEAINKISVNFDFTSKV